MLNKIWPIMIIISVIFGIFSGRIAEVNNAIFVSFEDTISMVISLLGIMCFWSGMIKVLENTKILKKIEKMLRPFIEKFFGDGKQYGIELIISKETQPLGTAGPLKLIEKELDSPFLVMNGDILTDLDFCEFYNFANMKDSGLTVALKKMILPYSFGNIEFVDDRVTKIVEKPDIITYALAGIYFMRLEVLKLIPENINYGMDKLILAMLSNCMPITKYEIEGYWLDVGREDDYEKAQKIYGIAPSNEV